MQRYKFAAKQPTENHVIVLRNARKPACGSNIFSGILTTTYSQQQAADTSRVSARMQVNSQVKVKRSSLTWIFQSSNNASVSE